MQACEQILSDKLLDQFAKRAGDYDRENRFFHEDFDELKRAGYLTMPVPKELGGARFDARRGVPPAAPARLLRPGDGARRQYAPLLGRAGRRSVAAG